MSRGWIKLYRKIQDNPLWTSEPFTRGQAWIDLLLLANHEQGYIYVRGNKITVKRGQVGWSQKRLSQRWHWSRTKVRKFLRDLEEEQQITQQKSTVTTIITLNNYGKYQTQEQQSEQQEDSRKAAEEQQKDTNKNDKNGKNEKKNPIKGGDSEKFKIPTKQQVEEYFSDTKMLKSDVPLEAQKFCNYYEEREWKTKAGKRIKYWKLQASTWKSNYLEYNRKRLKKEGENGVERAVKAINAIPQDEWED